MTKGSKFLLGVLGATAAGVAIGLLIAPEKGSETRKKLKKTANDWADNLSQMLVKGSEAVENGKYKVNQVKAAADEKVSKLKETFS